MMSLVFVIKDAILMLARMPKQDSTEQRQLRLEGIEAVVQQAWIQGHLEDVERDELERFLWGTKPGVRRENAWQS